MVNFMLEHFEQQLNAASPLTADETAKMAEHRIANGGDEVELTEYYNSRIDKKLLFFMKCDKREFKVCKVFDDEVEEMFKDATFIEMYDGGTVPKFEM